MNYNLFIKYNVGGFTILDLNEKKLPIVVDAYKAGKQKFTINGTEYDWGELQILKIFRNESSLNAREIEKYCEEGGTWVKLFGAGHVISPEFLESLGSNSTDEFLGDTPFGGDELIEIRNKPDYINKERITELRTIKSQFFDVSKLTTLCTEVNSNWAIGNYYTVGLLLRTIINHIPPIFSNEFTSFGNVIANYGNQSFKKNMEHLNISLRSIADNYTHDLIRKKEILPNQQQLEFRANIDILLAEIIRIIK